MKQLLFIPVLLIALAAKAQLPVTEVKMAMYELQNALVSKTTKALNSRLHPDVVFGHSNGWVQTKPAILQDLASGYLVYNSINTDSFFITRKKDMAWIRSWQTVSGSVNGTAFQLRLFVLQQWMRVNQQWQLTFRQSAKLQ